MTSDLLGHYGLDPRLVEWFKAADHGPCHCGKPGIYVEQRANTWHWYCAAYWRPRKGGGLANWRCEAHRENWPATRTTCSTEPPMAKHGAECARDERPANLLFWFGDGHCSGFDARVAADVEVSIGRTNSKRALGFIVTSGKRHVDFVLDRDQVGELAAFLQLALSRLRSPLGRKPDQLSLVAASSPKRRLFTALQNAAIDAHPGWHRINNFVCESDDGAPHGARLVAWFKKTHPRVAERIKRTLTKKLWEGK